MSFNSPPQKVWIFAGETSGDLYGAELALALRALKPDLLIQGMGGLAMRDAGVDILVDSTDLGVMGIVEVLKMYRTFKRIFDELVERAKNERPDVVVLIDYPGFNLRYAAKMKELGIKVVYYISPQIWAWKKKRAPKIAATVEHMMVIFPFEEHLYDKYNLPTTFIGHPLIEILQKEEVQERDDNLVLLLPGSRFTEVDRIFPAMFGTACKLVEKHPDMRFVIPTPREAIASHLEKVLRKYEKKGAKKLPVEIVRKDTYQWMRKATAAIAASGTVTVQCAILGLPLVSVYRMNPISKFIIASMAKVNYFTMVNIIADKIVYEEFIQGQVVPEKLAPALERILPGGERRQEVLDGIDYAVNKLGGAQSASHNAAKIVIDHLP